MNKRMILLAVNLCLVFSCALGINLGLAADPVKIACHGEFTGKYSVYGMTPLYAIRYEILTKNAEGGIKSLGGAKIELVKMDNATDQKNSVANHERLGLDKDILACIGPFSTPMATPTEPIAGKYRMPTIYSATASDAMYEYGNKYVFTTGILFSNVGRCYADFMIHMHKEYGLPLNRISIAYPDNDYGFQLAKGFKERMKKAGLEKNIVIEIPFNWKAKDLSSVVLKLKAAKPDFHFQAVYFADGKRYHDACYNLDFHPWQVGGQSGFNHPKLWKALGKDIAEATIGNNKTFAFNVTAMDLPNDYRDAWYKGFSKMFPKVPVEWNLLMGAMAARFLIDALEEAGERDREAVAKALHSLYLQKDDPRDFLGAYIKPGPVWGPNGRPNNIGYIVQWEKMGGKWAEKSVFSPTLGAIGVPRAFK